MACGLEAPTGTGKTEASAIWADRLAAAGLVDGMYFAVPTRSAATELHGRIAAMFGTSTHASLHGSSEPFPASWIRTTRSR